jgi:hypothetical protein
VKTLRAFIYLSIALLISTFAQAKEIKMAKANWDTGYFQAEVYKLALEKLGYKIKN